MHVCAADVGSTDHCLIWTVTSLELSKIGAAGNCSDGEQIKLEMTERKTARVPTRDGQNDVQFSELSKSIGTTNDDMERDNAGRSCLLYTSPSPRDGLLSRMPSSA